MSGNIEIANAGEVRNCCATLDKGVTYYKNLISELKNAKTKIQANWEGDAVAITEVITRIDQVTAVFEANVIPAMEGLSTSMVRFANESEKVSNNTLENSSGSVSGTVNGAVSGAVKGAVSSAVNATKSESASAAKKVNPASYSIWSGGFWKNIGQDFCDDWDFSESKGLISAVGDFVGGVANTAGSVVNTVGRVAGGIIDWIFG